MKFPMKLKLMSMLMALFLGASCFAQKAGSKEDDAKEKNKVLGSIIPDMKYSKEVILGNILEGSLQNWHFTKKEIDDDLSEDAFKFFLERVDFGKQFLLQEDVEKLSKYEDKFDDELASGKLEVVELSSKLLKKRIKEVQETVKNLLKKPLNYDEKDKFQTDPEKRDFATSKKELERRWVRILKFDIVNQYLDLLDEQNGEGADKDKKEKKKSAKKKVKKLSDKELEKKAREKVAKRYGKIFKRLAEEKNNEKLDKFYNSITKVFDPHTQYLIPEDKEDFDIDMSGKLTGIGALLREEGSYIKVERIIPAALLGKAKSWRPRTLFLPLGSQRKILSTLWT